MPQITGAMPYVHTPKQDFYAQSLVEQLGDLVDTLNEARADGFRFNFQIVDQGDKSPWVGVGPAGGRHSMARMCAIMPPARRVGP
jgi:hypothetical protein